jgi:hypothetical protein
VTFFLPPAADAVAPLIAKGLYRGTVADPDGDPDAYTVDLRITASELIAGKRAGRIAYRAPATEDTDGVALACKGTLSYRGRSGTTLRFRETMPASTAADCIDGGTVELTRASARRLTYRWTKPGDPDTPATASLSR